ncbi:MAG TPA: ParA family protein [Burkholderiaceae bacterium]|nr:ParA family protein [Burkholderiaceae bacterium]
MSVIAVVNRKGGSGKSTLATHFAAVFANAGATVALGDIDRQQSTRVWLRHRKESGELARILGWNVDAKTFVREPVGIEHVVVDTPGGLTGLDLARVVMYADAVVMPVSNSLFDRTSAADCLAELRTMPRVQSGRCRVAAVGMRLDPHTEAMERVRVWAAEHKLALIGALPQSGAYVRSAERGLTLFDVPQTQVQDELSHWKSLLQWLRPFLQPPANADPAGVARAPVPVAAAPAVPVVDQPKPETLSRGPRAAGSVLTQAPAPQRSDPPASASRLLDAVPRFLQRKP